MASLGRFSRIAAILTAILVVVNVAGYFLIHQIFPWMTMFPDGASAAASDQGQQLRLPIAVTPSGPTPAESVVQRVMGLNPSMFASPWQETARVSGVSASPFRSSCGAFPGPGPVAAASRGWAQSAGALPSDVTQAVNIEVRAYGAGEGAYAYQQIVNQADYCSGTYGSPVNDLGLEAAKLIGPYASVLVWRRGDVVMLATVRSADPMSYMDVWKKYDALLRRALNTTCVNPMSTVADTVRSPYANRRIFRGRGVPHYVHAPKTTPLPVPKSAPDARRVKRVPIPAPTLDAPYVQRPLMPSPPVTPSALPAPQTSPRPPAAPKRPIAQKVIFRRIADQVGPGCGWAFTRQQDPLFDTQTAQAQFETDRAETYQLLQQKWTAWQENRVAYYIAYARYKQAVKAYRQYAAQVSAVASAWAQIVSIRDQYRYALQQYYDALAARQAFFDQQASAQSSYDSALAACASGSSSSSSGGSGGGTSTLPGDSGAASPAARTAPDIALDAKKKPKSKSKSKPSPSPAKPSQSAKPSPKPSSTPTAPAPAPGPPCPPPYPSILDQAPPPLPPKPVAPDASFPEWYNPGHQVQ